MSVKKHLIQLPYLHLWSIYCYAETKRGSRHHIYVINRKTIQFKNSSFLVTSWWQSFKAPPLCDSAADSQGGELFMCRLSSQVCPCFASPHPPTHPPPLSPALHHLTSQSPWLPAPWTPCRSALRQEKYFWTKIYSVTTDSFPIFGKRNVIPSE